MKKKIIGLLALSLFLTACGNSENNNDKETINNKDEEIVESVDSKAMTDMSIEEADENKNEGISYDFELADLDGNIYRLKDQKGEKVYVKFWASWCPVCLSSLSELDEMSKNSEDYQIVTVVAPGIIGEKEKDDFKQWFEGLGYENIKVLLDESGKLVEDFSIRSTPTNIFFNSDGKLMGVFPGQLNKEALDEIFNEIS